MLPELMEVQTKDAIIQNFKGLNQKSFSSDEEWLSEFREHVIDHMYFVVDKEKIDEALNIKTPKH